MTPTKSHHNPQTAPFRWRDIPVKVYKEEQGTHFHGVTRQILADEESGLACQLRYFEIEPGGYSTLEKHQHTHVVMIIRGEGEAIVGDAIYALEAMDLIHVPPMTWHQFKAASDKHLGFLCLVNCDRDKPIRPGKAEMEELRRSPEIGKFICL